MASSYPGALDALANPDGTGTLGTSSTGDSHSTLHSDERDAIDAIQAELGTDPAGSEATVAARVAALDSPEDWHYVGEAGEPAFQNSWGNLGDLAGPGYSLGAFRREGAWVVISGHFYGGAFGDVLFTLPVGYRPSTKALSASFAGDFTGNTSFATVTVTAAGEVSASSPSAYVINGGTGLITASAWVVIGMPPSITKIPVTPSNVST